MLVSKIEDGIITINGKHPFAGKNITFFIDITSVQNKPSAGIGDSTFISPGPDSIH